MHVPLDLVPSTRLNSENFTQSPDSVVDLLGFDELAIMLTVTARTLVSASSIDVLLETAMENRDDRYFTLRELASLTSDSTDRYQKLVNLQGMGVADSDSASTTNKGFGRHVRVRVTGMGEGDIINFDVKAIARQHGGARMTPMSLDLVPHVRVSDDTYTQPLDSIVDLLGYNDVQMHLNVSGTGISPGTVPIYVATAMENRDDRYLRVYELVDLDNDIQVQKAACFSGPGDVDSDATLSSVTPFGLARYVRIETATVGSGGQFIAFDVQGLARSR